jgi:hypothetical protein
MAFFVKCLGIGFIIICAGACAAFVLYGGFFVKTDAEKAAENKLEIRKELHGAAGKAEDGKISQTIVVTPPVIDKK